MQINKFIQITLSTFFLTIGCEKNLSGNNHNYPNVDSSEIITKITENTDNSSFVLSCGSGCAMRYTPENIQQKALSINVKFKIETFIDEELSETFYEVYQFIYNKKGKIEIIKLENKEDNILQTLMPDAQKSFIDYSKILIKDIDISKIPDTNETIVRDNLKICSLPFDFEIYYETCYQNEKECEQRYPSYDFIENKAILEQYNIESAPTKFFLLSPINDIQPIICAYTDSDIEGYYLMTSKNKKLISSLKIGELDGITINDFVITKDYYIELFSKKENEPKVLKKRYKLLNNGSIKEV